MRSKQFVWVAMLVLAGTTGCAMCDNAQDWSYAAFGGKWQRDNPASGRVASLFDPAGGQVIEQGFPTEAEPAPEGMEQGEETDESLLEEPEEAEEAAETPMDASEEAATGAVPPETADGEQAESDANAGTDTNPAGGSLELPVLPGAAADTPKPEDDDAGLLPPLEPPP
jgi:hypothetical protein